MALDIQSVERELRKLHRTTDYNIKTASESVKDNDAEVDDGTNRPPGVKAAKARGKKKPMVEKSEFQTMCTIKQEDLVVKERLGKMKLLDSLIAKEEPLDDEEAALKKKFFLELMSN
ncbi:hypothetical protein F2Q69_00055973 [Brassica cretica]|uniref:No apical meristem-associated C-terminal domain-containing protein n=1 Tax=Brassica cretica TaxID=69181 RepID=A0A8S9N4Q1_BRACR|nr:hypothetical protein F2Q69_00055973 [Brassica cretica]